MKHTILICLFLIPALCFGQKYKELRKAQKEHQARADTAKFPTPFEFTFIDTSGLNKEQLFGKVNQWIATTFTNINLGAQLRDSSAGKIVIPGVSSNYASMRYDLTIDVKANKYRFVFNDYVQHSTEYNINTPISVAENAKGIYLGTNRESYWKDIKLSLMEEATGIYLHAKKFIEKKDDF